MIEGNVPGLPVRTRRHPLALYGGAHDGFPGHVIARRPIIVAARSTGWTGRRFVGRTDPSYSARIVIDGSTQVAGSPYLRTPGEARPAHIHLGTGTGPS